MVKEKLFSLINQLDDYSWLFTKCPTKNFSRKKKWSFSGVLKFLISMEGKSLKDELYEYFDYSLDTPTNSSLNQRRAQILPEALEYLFHAFTDEFDTNKTYKGYKLIACDGSDFCVPLNEKDASTYFTPQANGEGYNQLHLNVFYDLLSRTYIDGIIQPIRQENERRAMCDMLDRYKSNNKTIFIADRGYENYNIFAHADKHGLYYLIRVKDIDSNGILSAIDLPDDPIFDQWHTYVLTTKQTNEVKADKKRYKFVSATQNFDYLSKESPFYDIKFRVARFPISEDTYECIITNLPEDEFDISEIKKLYQMRWGIETSFRELKYAIGLANFHAKKTEYILQEIWARLLLYNFCEVITAHVVIEQRDNRKHIYQINFTRAIRLCCYFIKPKVRLDDLERLIANELLPVRPGRIDKRKCKTKTSTSFLYRVA